MPPHDPKYPDGKLNETDKGATRIAVFTDKGRVIIQFSSDLGWIGLDKKSLRGFIDLLESKYKIL